MDKHNINIYESGEMYLETIFNLKKRKSFVRSVDIVEELKFSKSSVSRAVNLLKSNGLILIDLDGSINFTEEGLRLAGEINERHEILTEFLLTLGVARHVAESDACRIEHVICDETFLAIKDRIKK